MKKTKSILLSCAVLASWWGIIYAAMYLAATLNLSVRGIGGEGEWFHFYYYMLALGLTLLLYFGVVPLLVKNKKDYLRRFRFFFTAKAGVYLLLLVVGAVIGQFIFGNLYGHTALSFVTALQPPIVEELLFRGLILSLLLSAFSPPAAILLSSLLFGTLHLALSPLNAAASVLIGIVYCLVVRHTKSTAPTMVMHYLQSTNLYQFGIGALLIVGYEGVSFLRRKLHPAQT